jgi:hypothetical protein
MASRSQERRRGSGATLAIRRVTAGAEIGLIGASWAASWTASRPPPRLARHADGLAGTPRNRQTE